MKHLTLFFRFIHIQIILIKHGLFFHRRGRGKALRLVLEELGPIFVKFGQVLSTRQDLLPADIAKELVLLQDCVPPFPTQEARVIIEKALGKPIAELFETFDDTPLAAASVAQVYSAVLHTRETVVVKVLRPKIRQKIQRDIDVLYLLARMAEWRKKFRRLKLKAVVHEFEINLMDEIDLRREAGNASVFRRNFTDSDQLYIPHVYWDYTRKHVMVMERVYGIPIADRDALLAHGVPLQKLAENIIDLFFTQVFRDAFFHADMHPGNIFVDRDYPEKARCICVDFGIIGSLSDSDKRYIAENFYAFFNRDYRRVAELHLASGWINDDVRLDRFESAIRTVSEPIFEKPLKDISLAHVILNLIQTAHRFHINIQPQLILLQKTLLSVEGLARQLYPELDLWTTAKPFLEKWIKKQIGVRAFLRHSQERLPFLMEHLPEFPELLYKFLKREVTK